MRLFGKPGIVERHRHRYEVSPQYIPALEGAGLVFSGASGNRMEICEIPGHPFFLATQFHPEFASRPARPSPIFLGFVEACREHRQEAGRGG
jgi:CTP synthase